MDQTSTAASSAAASSTILRALNKSSFKISKPIPRNQTRPSSPPPPPPTTTDATPTTQPQPPVYNIDKTNFRDVVQKLTGSPAHPPMPPPPPTATAAHPRPPSSRLHRIRPPPLAPPPPPQPSAVPAGGGTWLRPPFSPLPPFPTVSAAAESPITAYLRRLHAGPLLSPQGMGQPQSPLGFGCVPSPRLMFPTSPRLQMPSPK